MMKDKGHTGKKEAFRVPENYFEEFTDKITSEVKMESTERRTGTFKLIRPHLMLAASMAVLVVISYSLLKVLLPEMDISSEGIEESIIENMLAREMSETELFDALADLEESDFKAEPLEEVSNEEIVEYLLSSGISDYEIIRNQ